MIREGLHRSFQITCVNRRQLMARWRLFVSQAAAEVFESIVWDRFVSRYQMSIATKPGSK